MVTSCTPMPRPDTNRQALRLNPVVWNAMPKVVSEYQSRAPMKTLRRPNRSDSWPNRMVPKNSPAKVENTKVAGPPPNTSNRNPIGSSEARLNRPDATIPGAT